MLFNQQDEVNEYDFTLNQFYNGIILERDFPETEIINPDTQINPNTQTEKIEQFIKLEQQIKELEKKYDQLKNSLDNHYHVLPTSGMKEFEQTHPYYNKKLN